MTVNLPDPVADEEDIARVICKKDFFKTETTSNGEYFIYIKPVALIDNRTPQQTSVNRISTLSSDEIHSLNKEFQEQSQPDRTYYGYAKIKVKICRECGANVVKDDIKGTKPYHANIEYSQPQNIKEKDMAIAQQIALNATFIKSPPR